MGVQGAVAEFTFGGDPPQTRRAGRTVETVTPRGGLRLVITDEARAFILTDAPESTKVITVFLVVPRRSLPQPATRVAITAGDDGALRAEDRDGWLIDLGVGHACVNFCIRSGDPDLVARLRAVEGSTWRDALDWAGAVIVERSPHRVVITPLGRAEVYSSIPPPGGASPDGPHTHRSLRSSSSAASFPPAWCSPRGLRSPPPSILRRDGRCRTLDRPGAAGRSLPPAAVYGKPV